MDERFRNVFIDCYHYLSILIITYASCYHVSFPQDYICFPEYDYRAASLICARKGHGCVKSIQKKPGFGSAKTILWDCEDATRLSHCNPFNLHWDNGDFCDKEEQLYLVCDVKEGL